MDAWTPTTPSTRKVRVVCPRNCYDACGQIATVENGVLRRIDGDPAHPYTRGRLCAKGYSYVDRVYARDRLRHPMVQEPRGSGWWRRITWDEALRRVARSLIRLQERYGSLLPLCLYRGSGNLGVLHQAPDALFGSMGPITQAASNLCSTTGRNATLYDFGAVRNSDSADLMNARTMLLWGGNPAWTAPHQMSFLLEMKDRGARLIVIDPICSATASLADLHVPIRPGTDGAMALGMARHLWENDRLDRAFLAAHTNGWEAFLDYLQTAVTVEWASRETGLPEALIRQVADEYGDSGPSAIWIGFGMQRYRNAGQAVRAINGLAALTGQIGRSGAGVHYGHRATSIFSPSAYQVGDLPRNRTVSMGNLVAGLGALTDPPVRMLWVTGGNPMLQGPDTESLRRLLAEIETVVVVDQFLTHTAAEADIVLPATTHLEHWDLNVSYWHHCVAVNEQAIEPLGEARSDLAIALALSQHINRLRPGFCPFPTEGDERFWIRRVWHQEAQRLFDLKDPDDLRHGPRRAKLPLVAWADLRFLTPSGRYELWSDRAEAAGAPALPEYSPPVQPPPGFPVRLLTPHAADSLNSQFSGQRAVVELHPDLAGRLGLAEGQVARLTSPVGELCLPVRLTRTVPAGCAVIYGAAHEEGPALMNRLTRPPEADLADPAGLSGTAFADTFVSVAPARRC